MKKIYKLFFPLIFSFTEIVLTATAAKAAYKKVLTKKLIEAFVVSFPAVQLRYSLRQWIVSDWIRLMLDTIPKVLTITV